MARMDVSVQEINASIELKLPTLFAEPFEDFVFKDVCRSYRHPFLRLVALLKGVEREQERTIFYNLAIPFDRNSKSEFP